MNGSLVWQVLQIEMNGIIKKEENNSMNNVPPVFEKKEINYSGYIYNYLPVDMPVYTAV